MTNIIRAWLAFMAPAMGGGGGGASGPDPYEERKTRLKQSEQEVGRIFGFDNETTDQRLGRIRKEWVTANRGPVGRAANPNNIRPTNFYNHGLTQTINPDYLNALKNNQASLDAAAEARPELQSRADEFITAEKAKGPARFSPEWYESQRKQFIDYQTPDLERQFRDRQQKETLAAWGQGLGQSSEMGKSAALLQKALDDARGKIVQDADSYVGDLRGKVSTAKNNAIQMGGDSDVASASRIAGQQAETLSRPAQFSAPAQFFSSLATPFSYGAEAGIKRGGAGSTTNGPSLWAPSGSKNVVRTVT